MQTDTQAERERLEEEGREKAEELKEKAEELKEKASLKKEQAKEKAQSKAQKAAQTAKANSDNPVFVGNAVAIAALGGVIGIGAYKKYTAGEFTWKLAGAWAGVIGLFGVADYYVSQ